MARVLDKFPTEPWLRGKLKYPWHEWFNGQTWQIEQGVDYPATSKQWRFGADMRSYAKNHGFMMRLYYLEDRKTIIFRAERATEGEV